MNAVRKKFDFATIRVGEVLGRRRIEISDRLIGDYAAAIEAIRPWYAQSSPFGAAIAPPTIFADESLRLLDECYERFGSIHAQQSWQFLHPVRRGATVDVDVRIVDKFVKRGDQYLVMELIAVDQSGIELCRGRHTSLISLRTVPA